MGAAAGHSLSLTHSIGGTECTLRRKTLRDRMEMIGGREGKRVVGKKVNEGYRK